jgi:hypothetical protein
MPYGNAGAGRAARIVRPIPAAKRAGDILVHELSEISIDAAIPVEIGSGIAATALHRQAVDHRLADRNVQAVKDKQNDLEDDPTSGLPNFNKRISH